MTWIIRFSDFNMLLDTGRSRADRLERIFDVLLRRFPVFPRSLHLPVGKIDGSFRPEVPYVS